MAQLDTGAGDNVGGDKIGTQVIMGDRSVYVEKTTGDVRIYAPTGEVRLTINALNDEGRKLLSEEFGVQVEEILKILKNPSPSFPTKYFIGGLILLLVIIAIIVVIWQKDLLGLNRFFSAKDQNFKILVLPFKQICMKDSQSYDAGYVVTERLNSITSKEKLKIKAHYWFDYDFKNFNDETAKTLRKYHKADMILFGAYQTDACSSDGNQVCINYITDEKWHVGESGMNLNRDYEKGGIDELKKGKLQIKIENLATFISLIAQVKSIDHEAYVKKLKTALNDENLNQSAQAALYIEIADKLQDEGKSEEVIVHYKKALKIYESNQDKYYIAVCYERIGDAYSELGKWDTVLALFQKMANILETLYNANPSNAEVKNRLAISYERLGEISNSLGKLDTALFFFEKYSQLEKELCDTYPQMVNFKENLAISYSKLGEMHHSLGHLNKAVEYFEKDFSTSKELYVAYPQNIEFKNGLAWSCLWLGIAHSRLNHLDTTLMFFEEMAKLFEALHAEYPHYVSCKNGLAIAYEWLGSTHYRSKNFYTALKFLKKRYKLGKELYTEYPQNVELQTGWAWSNQWFGIIYSSMDNLNKSSGFSKIANELFENLYLAHNDNMDFKSNYAEALATGFAIQKRINPAQDTKNIDMAIQLFEEIYSTIKDDDYQKKIAICKSMKAEKAYLKQLISEMSAF